MASIILSRILQKRYLIIPNTYSLSVISKHNAWYSTKKSLTNVESNETDNKVQIGTAEVVKENLKSAGQLGIIISGIGITALILYTLFSELFSSESVDAIYSKARIRCMEHPKLIDLLGAPIKAYGDETNRRRRRRISHMYYIKDGIEYMKLKFYLEGTRRRGTAFAEVKKRKARSILWRVLATETELNELRNSKNKFLCDMLRGR
ncbi:mitochondrial import inner membrane translocase subunit Tim21 isoform X2 [Nylanderia fulva]|uniref:mitochondrial import inner membrane translocase subunit Tim21 isoform X2 n=1 Tax=Nylanderia fulva TaxID=613905 RepID=UPI0010FB5D1E|nr:mitochondrial import inner membrane translocase subunit Tim21 isoform X2 [Nylanderia fulva]